MYFVGVPFTKPPVSFWQDTVAKRQQRLQFSWWEEFSCGWDGRAMCHCCTSRLLFRTCKTHFIFGEKCAHFSALYYV